MRRTDLDTGNQTKLKAAIAKAAGPCFSPAHVVLHVQLGDTSSLVSVSVEARDWSAADIVATVLTAANLNAALHTVYVCFYVCTCAQPSRP